MEKAKISYPMHAPKVPKLSITPVTEETAFVLVPKSDEQVIATRWSSPPQLHPIKISKIWIIKCPLLVSLYNVLIDKVKYNKLIDDIDSEKMIIGDLFWYVKSERCPRTSPPKMLPISMEDMVFAINELLVFDSWSFNNSSFK